MAIYLEIRAFGNVKVVLARRHNNLSRAAPRRILSYNASE